MGGGGDLLFLTFLISLLKWYLPTAVSFITASHTLTKRVLHSILSLMFATFFSQNRVYFPLFLQELSYVRHFSRTLVWLVYKSITTVNIQLSRRKFNNYSDTVCRYTNLFHWWKCAQKYELTSGIFVPCQRYMDYSNFVQSVTGSNLLKDFAFFNP